ncbi:MAG TPA: amino acid permease [Candidatus Omnitrophota bacterium]|nr:amino acid permease [Candidatus Omnitrophota bacterium]
MSSQRFGTFEGVFVPSLLSIFGVIMYLRLSWVVGQVGIIAALIIIIASNMISLLTGFSVSSIVTNIRIGHGGAYSIITKSLGAEAGGAIGLPLYLAQAISMAFYVVGFAECWINVFPQHSFLIVCLLAWFFILWISYCSARIAFRTQYFILGIIILSLISIFLGQKTSLSSAQPTGTPFVSSGNFFVAFAVFFPAVTGFMSGLSMSGELEEPKKSIPIGTLLATGLSFVIYLMLAVWLSLQAGREELVHNTNIIVDIGRWPALVIAGIMGATLSSAINMCVTAPRTLFALSQSKVFPLLKVFAHRNKKDEPTTAILLTAFIALVTILAGTLNQVATILTMFFLITYGLINFSVFVEQWIGIASFRPSFRVPRIVPLAGWVGCLSVMFLINPVFSWIAWITIGILYMALMRRKTVRFSPDVRSGLLIFLSEQMAKAAARLPYYPKIWKPNVAALITDLNDFQRAFSVLDAIVYPNGRLTAFCFEQGKKEGASGRIQNMIKPFAQKGIFSEGITLAQGDPACSISTVLQTLKSTHFPPNAFFCVLPESGLVGGPIQQVVQQASREDLGIILHKQGQVITSTPQRINLWVRKGSPNIDLSILLAIQLQRNWDGYLCLVQAVASQEESDDATAYLARLGELMRLPGDLGIKVLVGDFAAVLGQAPQADINIFGMPERPDFDFIHKCSQGIKTSILFLRDSPHESAIA